MSPFPRTNGTEPKRNETKQNDQIVIAEVKDSGRFDGALTATFTCDFPGEYLVYVEEVEPKREGHPIKGSPFSLTVTGPGPTLDVDSLPVCGSEGDARDDRRTEESFWRPGTWLSSRVASATRGVTRDGWVFQPRTCAFDTFSHEDIMLLAGMKAEEPTWLLVLGGPVQRGVFLSLVDMALAQGQKDEIGASAVRDCSGYADVRIGNLRVTYQVRYLVDGFLLGRRLHCLPAQRCWWPLGGSRKCESLSSKAHLESIFWDSSALFSFESRNGCDRE